MVEQWSEEPCVAGPIPALGTEPFCCRFFIAVPSIGQRGIAAFREKGCNGGCEPFGFACFQTYSQQASSGDARPQIAIDRVHPGISRYEGLAPKRISDYGRLLKEFDGVTGRVDLEAYRVAI